MEDESLMRPRDSSDRGPAPKEPIRRPPRAAWVFLLVLAAMVFVFVARASTLPLPSGLSAVTEPAPLWNSSTMEEDRTTSEPVSRDRGIVMSMNDDAVPMGLSLIRELRCLGNRELVQVYHCFADELSNASRALLLGSDDRLELVDACTDLVARGELTESRARMFRSWWLKPLALYHTNLTEVLLLDVDDIFLHDPADVRSTPGYVSTGTTFFFDRVVPSRKFFNDNMGGTTYLKQLIRDFDYAKFDVSGPVGPSKYLQTTFAFNGSTAHEQDSSLVAVDKSRPGMTQAMNVLFFLISEQQLVRPFSFGDKEAFWLAFELAHTPYAFSPWGASDVSSSTNNDLEAHNDTLCGSLAQFLPVDDAVPQLLYVNGKALLDPFPFGVERTKALTKNVMYNVDPTHVTPRQVRRASGKTASDYRGSFRLECLVGMGATPLPDRFAALLLRRRMFYLGIRTGVLEALDMCHAFGNN